MLQTAKNAFPKGAFICKDVNRVHLVSGRFDVGIYSHVVERLPSPESSLFEPPAEGADWIELKDMDIGADKTVPYLRRKMSQNYFEMILEKIGCMQVDVYKTSAKD